MVKQSLRSRGTSVGNGETFLQAKNASTMKTALILCFVVLLVCVVDGKLLSEFTAKISFSVYVSLILFYHDLTITLEGIGKSSDICGY